MKPFQTYSKLPLKHLLLKSNSQSDFIPQFNQKQFFKFLSKQTNHTIRQNQTNINNILQITSNRSTNRAMAYQGKRLKTNHFNSIIIRRYNNNQHSLFLNRKCKIVFDETTINTMQTSRQSLHYADLDLDHKIIKRYPFLMPIPLTFMNNYSSMSEKKRHEKILTFINKYKYLLESNPDKVNVALHEFLMKNRINFNNNLNEEKMTNFKNYINQRLGDIDATKSLQEIIDTAFNFNNDSQPKEIKKDLFNVYVSRNIRSQKEIKKHIFKSENLSSKEIDLYSNADMNSQKLLYRNEKVKLADTIDNIKQDIYMSIRPMENISKHRSGTFDFITSDKDYKRNETNRIRGRFVIKRQGESDENRSSLSKKKSNCTQLKCLDSFFNRRVIEDSKSNLKIFKKNMFNTDIDRRFNYNFLTKDAVSESIYKAKKVTEYAYIKIKENTLRTNEDKS